MKVKRYKSARKILTFYKNHFDIQCPYHVLVDGTFCKTALKFKMNISEQLPKYLDAEVRLCTTTCVLAECKALGPLLYGPLKVLQQFSVHKCGHFSPLAPNKCMSDMARRQIKEKYFVATQDVELSQDVRHTAGVPLLYISHNSINLERPSPVTQNIATGMDTSKMTMPKPERKAIRKLKKEVLGSSAKPKREERIRKKHKGPNPLSCKKKKKTNKVQPHANSTHSGRVNKRKRKRKINTSLYSKHDLVEMVSLNKEKS